MESTAQPPRTPGVPATEQVGPAAYGGRAQTVGEAPIQLVCLSMGTVLTSTDEVRMAPVPDAKKTLTVLRSHGVSICLTSSSSAPDQAALLDRLGWSRLIDLVICAEEGLRAPPYPDLVLTAVMRLQADDLHRVAVVGATPDEMLAGYRAGAGFVAGLRDHGHARADLGATPHGRLLGSIADLPALLVPAPPAPEPGLDREVGVGKAFRPATPPAPAILDVADLSIYYGTHRAVNGLSVQVLTGEIFGLLGPNGAGKTSTLSAIEGLLRPRSGRISLDGIDVLRHPLEAKMRMGVQLQATSFQTSLTLKQIVRLYAGLYGIAISDTEIAGVLGEVGLEADIGREYKQLSGGQKQRLSLQIAVIHSPSLLLLDEPTSGLDPQARRQLWGRIEHLRQNGGSILLTTHSMEEAQAVCDRVAIMDHGQILTSGSPADLIAAHRHDPKVTAVSHGEVTLDDVFVGLTGTAVRD